MLIGTYEVLLAEKVKAYLYNSYNYSFHGIMGNVTQTLDLSNEMFILSWYLFTDRLQIPQYINSNR
jgi:hypothetical protein